MNLHFLQALQSKITWKRKYEPLPLHQENSKT